MKCYFCLEPLSKFLDKEQTGNYDRHYCCYNCPLNSKSFKDIDIWKPSYTIILDPTLTVIRGYPVINVEYLYFHTTELWLHIFHGGKVIKSSLDIKNNNNKSIIWLQQDLNPFSYAPKVLEEKIKTWVTFS